MMGRGEVKHNNSHTDSPDSYRQRTYTAESLGGSQVDASNSCTNEGSIQPLTPNHRRQLSYPMSQRSQTFSCGSNNSKKDLDEENVFGNNSDMQKCYSIASHSTVTSANSQKGDLDGNSSRE